MFHIISAVDNNSRDKKIIDKAVKYLQELNRGKLSVVYINHDKVEQSNGKIISRETSNNIPKEFRKLSKSDIEYNFSKIEKNKEQSKVDRFLKYVEENKADQIYVGHRKLPLKTEQHVGSFAKELLGKTNKPVTVVPTR